MKAQPQLSEISWQKLAAFLLDNMYPGREISYKDPGQRDMATCFLLLISTRIVLSRGDLLSFHAFWETWREKKNNPQTLIALKILQTQD